MFQETIKDMITNQLLERPTVMLVTMSGIVDGAFFRKDGEDGDQPPSTSVQDFPANGYPSHHESGNSSAKTWCGCDQFLDP